jgi:tetratricopeptide (TPR) repeat protein
LEPDRKRLLQDASVVGPTFWLGAVTSLGSAARGDVEAALRQLEQREFVRRERRSAVEGEPEYVFRHGLVRDAAYGQIPRAERSDRHRLAAEWIAALGRSDDHAELVAHHYLEAIRYAKAAGGDVSHLAAPARAALRDAGERALRLASHLQAARYLEAALELTADGDDRGELMYHYGLARLYGDSTGEDVLAQAVALLRDSGRRELAARAALLLARYAWSRMDHDGTDGWLGQIDELTADDPESITRLETAVARGGFLMVGGQYQRAIDAATAALQQLDTLDRPDLHARALDVRGTSRCALGDENGLDDSRRAIEIATAGRAIFELHHAINNVITSAVQLGRTSEVRGLMDTARAAYEEFGGTHYSRLWFLAAEAEFMYNTGDWDGAVDATGRFLAGIPEGQPHYLESGVLAQRAMIRFARGQEAGAVADAQRALELVQQASDPQNVVPTTCLHGRLMIVTGRPDLAEADWTDLFAIEDALPSTLPQGAIPDFAWLAVDLDHRVETANVIDRCQMPIWIAVGRAILSGDAAGAADTLDDMDRPTEAAYARLRAGGEHIRTALRFYESVGATRFVEECLALLEASA